MLEPIGRLIHDPMHVFFSNGICRRELELLLPKLATVNVGFQELRSWLAAAFKTPCYQMTKHAGLAHAFCESRENNFKKSGSFAPSASPCLALVPVIRYFCWRHNLDRLLPHEVASWSALGDVVHLLNRAKTGAAVAPELRAALRVHADLFTAAYGDVQANFLPEFHYARHVPEQIEDLGFSIDCFVTERKHNLLKKAAEPFLNTQTFERSVLARALALHIN